MSGRFDGPDRCGCGVVIYNGSMTDSFGQLEASTLFCPRCKTANPVRKSLLLVLPDGNKYDYMCSVCGTQVGGKTDSDSTDFHRIASASRKSLANPNRESRPPSR
jgi:hypothetical protein